MEAEQKTVNRRNMLKSSSAVGLGVVALAAADLTSCNTQAQTITSQVIDAVQKAVALGCTYVPDVATLLAILAEFPGLAGVTAIPATLLSQVSTFLCQNFAAQGGVVSAVKGQTIKAKLSSGGEVPVHGLVFDPGSGKFVSF